MLALAYWLAYARFESIHIKIQQLLGSVLQIPYEVGHKFAFRRMGLFRTVNKNNTVVVCTYECTLLPPRRLLLLAFENGGRGGLNLYQTGNKWSGVEGLFNNFRINF